MIAREYIAKYVEESARPFATVVISAGRKFTHMPLRPEQEVVDEDDRNITVFIHIDHESMPPVLIADHNCDELGLMCEDHPDEPSGHAGCFGQAIPCPYPGCIAAIPDVEGAVINIGYPDPIGEAA